MKDWREIQRLEEDKAVYEAFLKREERKRIWWEAFLKREEENNG